MYVKKTLFPNYAAIVLIFLVFILTFLLFKSRKRSYQFPPGPRGWPIIGSLANIDKESYLTFDEWGKKYGSIFSVNLGSKRGTAVFLTSSEAVKCALKDQGDKIANRFALPLVKVSVKIPGSIVFENGPVWSERRRWTFGILRSLCQENNNLENRINVEADYLCQEITKNGDESFNPLHCINNAVSNIICTVSFGDRFEYSDVKFKELMKGIRYIFENAQIQNPVNVFPFLYYTPWYKQFRHSVKTIKSFLNEVISNHLETFDSYNIRDFIDAYILESKKEDVDLKVFSMDLLYRTLYDLFFGGTDTTTCSIMWIIVYLVNYPEVQLKVQAEIDRILGQKTKPTWRDRHSLPFLQATIMEVLRLSNPTPLFGRSASHDVNINGYKVPAGTSVIASIWSIHMDSQKWDSPLDFKPERFLSDDLTTIKKNDSYMPFGAGRRVCIGDLMARMELFLFTSNIMQRFTFKIADDRPRPLINECVPGLTRYPKSYEIIAVKR